MFRLHGLDVDWSLPRADSSGRKPQVYIDPFMSFKEAFRRRDLTINAMGIDILSGELIDPFGGRSDLDDKLLRTPDVRLFIQDPLRFFRVMQFISRFEMIPDDKLIDVCKTMDISNISRERIEVEFEKMLLQSHLPSRGIRWIQVIDRLSEVLPELFATVGIQQNPEWHTEGDVFEHTMQTSGSLPVSGNTFLGLRPCLSARKRSASSYNVTCGANLFAKRLYAAKRALVATNCMGIMWYLTNFTTATIKFFLWVILLMKK